MGTEPAQNFRTEDMALVSVLRYHGHTPQSVEWESGRPKGKCYWFFMRTVSLENVVEQFLTRSLLVEPRQFNHLFGETKQEFYKHYDANKGR